MKLLRIDALLLPQHYYLDEDDICLYFGDYSPRAGHSASSVNSMICNLKKSVERRGRPEYIYKTRAIDTAAEWISNVIGEETAKRFSFVPIPSSKCRTDPLYDDRAERILMKCRRPLDVRHVLACRASTKASHQYAEGEKRPTPRELQQNLIVSDVDSLRQHVILFDDVITAGAHFKACKGAILARRDDLVVVGLFLARSARQLD